MPETVDTLEAVRRCRAAVVRRAGTRWVGIDGKGGAGKTTLAARIAEAVPAAAVVHIDDFSAPAVRGWERDRFRRQVVDPLLEGRPARYQRWDWPSDSGAEWHTITPGGVVVCEGVSSTDARLEVPWDFTCWVEAPREVRLARARERDGAAMIETWLTDWMPSEDAYEAEQRPQDRVDVIVTGAAP